MQSSFFIAFLLCFVFFFNHLLTVITYYNQVDSSEDSKLTLHQVFSITQKDNPFSQLFSVI